MIGKKINKNALCILSIIIFSFLVLLPILHKNFYISHDGEAHVARFAAYYSAFRDGQIPPRWAGNLNSGYGSSLFIFFYPLPGYIASFLHIFGFSFETIFKMIISLSFILAPVVLFLWLKSFSKISIAYVAAIAYLLLPYRFLDTFVRGDVAEMLSFVFVPLIFMCITKASKNESKGLPIILGGICYALLILSHNAIAVIFTPVFIIYAIVFSRRSKDLESMTIFVIGLALSAYFWIPAITESKYVYSNLLVEGIYKYNFIPLLRIFYSPWGFGPNVNVRNGLSPQIGILYGGIFLLALFLVFRTRHKKEIIFWLVIFVGAIFMTTPYSILFWEKLPVIKLMGYPWRFTALSGFASCMVLFYLLHYADKKYFIFVTILFFIFAIPFIKVKGYNAPKSDDFYFTYQGTTDYHMRTMSIWVAGDFWEKAKKQVGIISGKGTITNIIKKSNKHTFSINAQTNVVLIDNTVYFPGWKVYVDKISVPVQFQDMNHRGLITFPVSQGSHNVVVAFKETGVRLLSDILSFFTAIILIFIIMIVIKNRAFNKIVI